jgi:hypothetical protein
MLFDVATTEAPMWRRAGRSASSPSPSAGHRECGGVRQAWRGRLGRRNTGCGTCGPLVLLAAGCGQDLVTAGLDDLVEVVVAFLLVIAAPGLEGFILRGSAPAQFVKFGAAHALSGQAAGHAFQDSRIWNGSPALPASARPPGAHTCGTRTSGFWPSRGGWLPRNGPRLMP